MDSTIGQSDSYTLVRNNTVLASGISTLSYNDNGLYPSDYNYVAKAHYVGLGYSHSSNDTTVTIAGGIARKNVLFEVTTSVGCYYCPGAALGMEGLESNGKDVVIVEYHNNWQGRPIYKYCQQCTLLCICLCNFRYWQSTAIADGSLVQVGGNHTTSLYPNYLPMYNARISRDAIHDIDLTIVKSSVDTYEATVVVEQLSNYYPSNLKLRTALTESNINYSWQGQTKLHWVCRDMYPNANGTNLDFSSSTTQTFTTTFSTAGFVSDNCEFAAWVQLGATDDVTQAVKVKLNTVTGIEQSKTNSWNIYPNPANNQLTISGMEKAQYEIININGQVVMSGLIENGFETINISNLNNGSYFARIIGSEVIVKPFVVQ